MVVINIGRGILIAAFVAMVMAPTRAALGGEGDSLGQVRRAIVFLDSRQETWSRFDSAGRGTAEDRTTCLSCHTGISFVLTRPLLGRFVDSLQPVVSEERMISSVTRRVAHWSELDSPRFRLMYDHDERKKVESWGTEAVLNTLILASDDKRRGRASSSEASRSALKHLWETQESSGSDAGSWNWLNFGLEPWEGEGSRAFGATLAVIAVGSAPGYLDGPLDEQGTRGVNLLRTYLRSRLPEESLHNRLWILEASASFKGLISPEQSQAILDQVRALQREDGGWSLAALGQFQRVDGSTQPEASDGYATGLALHALIGAGVPKDQPSVAKGLGWLGSRQRKDGSWPGISVNKERDPASFAAQLMTDAATAFSARALVDAGQN